MRPPVIGITCQFDPDAGNRSSEVMNGTHRLPDAYPYAVRRGGGLPMLLPTTADADAIRAYIGVIDGLILSGGGDIAPEFMAVEPEPGLGAVDPIRDTFELALAREAIDAETPILAICKGIQVLNVATGGRVIQDLDSSRADAVQHAQRAPGWHGTHTIDIEPASLLARTVGSLELRVNSFHHQANRDAGRGLVVSARAKDGVIEAVEGDGDAFVLGVQFHPESMVDAAEPMAALFRGLVDACAARA
ncbi:gamma-glutamyl-gamma-aminobutyrate hydrolase family protein [Candidatus Poribacteria bacterium]|jgi:putative glutamine amidotransferase|nr:gamma-glutamyl-gamma-aminobutyrate hydrolase family protein [Candidatus Poribacteria bacterium]MBT7100001.1 gamma-glutamyl-gamma-aminobutyrate hydrolase family protein [Candidatus Poribacteria bacterium]MBT7804065.1 gamma-glutamyl-gamma-aminobutyrate hydrolase family protein [Candidatus Poribacteria bacterium]